jgi:hypothetical protein
MVAQIRKWLPDERITRVRNLALFLTGLYLSRKVHLSLIVRKWPTAGKVPSLVNRLRRFLDNPRVDVRAYYRPVAQSLVDAFRGQPIRLVIDTTRLGFNARLMTVSIAYRKRCPGRKCVSVRMRIAQEVLPFRVIGVDRRNPGWMTFFGQDRHLQRD